MSPFVLMGQKWTKKGFTNCLTLSFCTRYQILRAWQQQVIIHISKVITIQHKRGPISRSQQSPAIQNVYDIVAEPEPWFVVLISALRSQRNLALLASGMKETRRNIHLLTKRPKIGRNLSIRFLCESLPSACNNENYTYPGLSDVFWNVWYQ